MTLRIGGVLVLVMAAEGWAGWYSQDFEDPYDPLTEWSNTSTDSTPGAVSWPSTRFLGQFVNDTVTLTLDNLPAHDTVTVDFYLYIINSWDGNRTEEGGEVWGPDKWDLSIQGGPQLIHTTFSTHPVGDPYKQSYPGWYPGDEYEDETGSEPNELGYARDTLYHIVRTFAHSDGSVLIDFSAIGLQEEIQPWGLDESWGLDNVSVTPEPTTVGLMLLGGLAVLRRHRA